MVSISRFIIFFILSFGLVFYSYTVSGRYFSYDEIKKMSNQELDFKFKLMGYKSEKGNLILVSLGLNPIDYYNEETFFSKVDSIIKLISEKNLIQEKSLIVFPEHFGSFLFLMEEKKEIFKSKNFSEVKSILKNSNPELFFTNSIIPKLILSKKNKILQVYKNTFQKISKKYGVSIFSGSIVLPELKFQNENLQFVSEKLINQSLIFTDEGKIYDKIGIAKNVSEIDSSVFQLSANSEYSILEFMDTSFLLSEDSKEFDLTKMKTSHLVSVNFKSKEDSIFYDKIKSISQNKSYSQIFFKGNFFDFNLFSNEIQSIRYINLEEHKEENFLILNHFLN